MTSMIRAKIELVDGHGKCYTVGSVTITERGKDLECKLEGAAACGCVISREIIFERYAPISDYSPMALVHDVISSFEMELETEFCEEHDGDSDPEYDTETKRSP